MQPPLLISWAEPSRAVPCHHFPLIKRVCLCKAWYMRGWHTVACLRLWHNCNIHIMLSRSASVRTFLFILRWNHSNSAVTHLICVCFLFICWKFQDLNDSKSAGTLICWWTFRNKTVKYRLSFVSSHFLFINQVWLYERRWIWSCFCVFWGYFVLNDNNSAVIVT